jgi:hypothetical protein
MSEYKLDESGIYYFDELPKDVIIAEPSDFYDENKTLRVGLKYIIHGFYSGKYEIYKIHQGLDSEKLIEWFKENRIFMKKENKNGYR